MDSLIGLVISVSSSIAAHKRILTTFIEIIDVANQVSSLQWVLNNKERSKFTITLLLLLRQGLHQTLPEAIKEGIYNGLQPGYSLASTPSQSKMHWFKQISRLIQLRLCSGSWTLLPNKNLTIRSQSMCPSRSKPVERTTLYISMVSTGPMRQTLFSMEATRPKSI